MKTKGLFFLLCTLILTAYLAGCSADVIGPETLLTGEYSEPVRIVTSAPSFQKLAQFGKERTDELNRLLKHVALRISTDGSVSESVVFIDDDPVYSVTEKTTGNTIRSVYSFESGKIYEKPASDRDNTGFTAFLDQTFFLSNRMMDELYTVFTKAAEAFPEFMKTTAESLNYRGFGKTVSKVTIQFPAEYVKEHFPQALAGLAGTDESRSFVQQFLYKGMQKIILSIDRDGRVLCIRYDGTVGLSEEAFRKVSLSWRCLREQNHTKDQITLKTPSVKGYDRYNLIYARDCDSTDPENRLLSWDFQLDLKEGEEKKKIRYNAELSFTENTLKGSALYSEKENGQEYSTAVTPEINKENDGRYSGTLEITNNSGKIVISDMTSRISIAPGDKLSMPGDIPETAAAGGQPEESDGDSPQPAINRLLIRRMMSLPADDTVFLTRDIPEDILNSLIQSLF